MLRTNLQFMNVDNPPRRIVVTSALPGEGKSTVAANLAGTLAANGAHVILVDGDLRRPTVAESTGVDGAVGLTDVLAGRLEITDALRRVRGVPNLLVLPAGTLPPNPSELAGSERMHKLLADLAKHAIVIIDAPPLLAVTDGAVLTRAADGALIVVSAGHTSYDTVDDAVAVLEKIHGHVLGVVLNRVAVPNAGAYGAYAYDAKQPRSSHAAASRGANTPAATPAASADIATAPEPGRRRGVRKSTDEDVMTELFGRTPADDSGR
jgi:capsular exopolysaccharide synthesis family protein